MKLNKWLFAGAFLALGLTSCNKENPEVGPNSQEEGNTYMSVSFDMPSMRDNADADYNNDLGTWDGRDKIKTVDIYLIDQEGTVVRKEILGTDVAPTSTAGVYTTKAFETTAGQKTAYVVVNPDGDINDKLRAAAASSASDFEAAYKNEYKMLAAAVDNGEIFNPKYATMETLPSGDKKDVIIMSGKPGSLLVQDNVSQQDAENGQNRLNVEVSRAAARVVLSFSNKISIPDWTDAGDGSVEVKAKINGNPVVLGTLSKLSWTVAQYEKTSFFLQKMAPTASEGVMSPSYAYVPVNNNYADALNHYDYSLHSEKFTIKPFDRTLSNAEQIDQIIKMDMKFITETTHKSGILGTSESDYRRGNTPYAMVRGTFKPASGMFAPGEEANYVEGQDLYLGLVDGKFYTSKANAIANNRAGGDPGGDPDPNNQIGGDNQPDNVITYKTGQMFYFVWVNPNVIDPAKWYNSPVLRNNIYHINVAGFKKLGFSGNPYDPDPVDPVDPDEPTPDPDDPLNDKETYMSVEVSVIPWGMHSFDITL